MSHERSKVQSNQVNSVKFRAGPAKGAANALCSRCNGCCGIGERDVAGSCPWHFLRKGLYRKDLARPEGRIASHAILAKAY